MTYLTKDIADHLKGSTPILDAVGQHIYPDLIPQGVKWRKAIVLSDLSNDPEYMLAGESGTHTSIITVDCWTDGTKGYDKQAAVELGEMVRNRMSGYRGQFGTGVYGTARLIRNDKLAQRPDDGSNIWKRRVSQDYEVIHSADVPTFA